MELNMFGKREAQTRAVHDFVIDSETQLSNPVLKRFDAIWRAGADEDRLPGRATIDPSLIADVLPHMMLVDVVRDGDDDMVEFRSRFVGEHQVGIDGRRGAGERIYRNPDESDELVEVASTGRPIYTRCRVESDVTGTKAYERVTYPLASNGVDIDAIASIMVPHGTVQKSRLHTFFSWF